MLPYFVVLGKADVLVWTLSWTTFTALYVMISFIQHSSFFIKISAYRLIYRGLHFSWELNNSNLIKYFKCFFFLLFSLKTYTFWRYFYFLFCFSAETVFENSLCVHIHIYVYMHVIVLSSSLLKGKDYKFQIIAYSLEDINVLSLVNSYFRKNDKFKKKISWYQYLCLICLVWKN